MAIRWSSDPDGRHTSRSIVASLDQAIRLGELESGAQLPTQRRIAEELGVSLGTVERAMAELKRRGLIDSTVGSGTFVRSSFGPLDPITAGVGATPRTINLATNETFTLPIEEQELARTLRAIAEEGGLSASPSGIELQSRFLEAGWSWLEPKGYVRGGAELRLAVSAQNAISSVFLAMARSGDAILHGASLFPGIRNLALRLGCPLHAVPEDEEGPRPEAVEALLSKHSVALLYLVPTSGPIGSRTISERRRHELASLAQARDLVIVEDEDEGALMLDRPAPLQSLAPEHVIAVVETSKNFATGSRLCYASVPAKLFAAMSAGQRATTWNVPWLPAEVATRWIQSGFADVAETARRVELRARHQLVKETLASYSVSGGEEAHSVWLHLPDPWSPGDVEQALTTCGVSAGPTASYASESESGLSGMRLCLGSESSERLERGLHAIRDTLDGPYRPARLSAGAGG